MARGDFERRSHHGDTNGSRRGRVLDHPFIPHLHHGDSNDLPRTNVQLPLLDIHNEYRTDHGRYLPVVLLLPNCSLDGTSRGNLRKIDLTFVASVDDVVPAFCFRQHGHRQLQLRSRNVRRRSRSQRCDFSSVQSGRTAAFGFLSAHFLPFNGGEQQFEEMHAALCTEFPCGV